MSQDINAIFSAKRNQVSNYYEKWSDLQKNIIQLLNNVESEESISVTKTDLDLQDVINIFTNELDNPLITLATTGTTSGGKSSLVNLLCGAEIMPTAVLEMSAGTVIIDHHPTKRTLKIPIIEGLPNDYCGEWTDLVDSEIRRHLQQVMDAYRKLREENREPHAPRIEIQYPTRLGMRPESAGLPDGFRLRIIDLPGFKYVTDDHNKQIIRQEIKPALCLVTYNSEETDPIKQQTLLDDVVNQVRELRGSPARMLFILNRIDVFRRDPDFEVQTHNFIKRTTQNIRNSVAQALPEYLQQASEIVARPLSTYPALCAYQALHKSEELSIQALEQIDSKFNLLIPTEMIDDLPRRISKWKDPERKKVAEAVWHSSFGYSFDETLKQHIQDNIPQLLLPHLIKVVVDSANESLTNAHQITYARLNATRERYQKECERLNNISFDLQELREKSKQQLFLIVNFSDEDKDEDIIEKLADIASELQETYQLPKYSLEPLHDWSIQLGQAIEAFLSSIHKAIIEGNIKPQGEIVDSLPPQEREIISRVLKNLHDSGYRDYANYGGHVDTDSQDEKNKLRKINQSLNELAEILAKILKLVLDSTSEREAERIQDSLQILIKGYANIINEKAQSMATDLVGLTITPSELVRVKQRLLLNFQLIAGFNIHQEYKDVKVGDKQVKTGERQVKIGTKRLWYTLWIKKKDIYETRNVYVTKAIYEKRSYDAAVIPSVTDIFSNFITQAKYSRHETEFVRWLRTQLDGFLKGIEQYQENLLEGYRQRLDEAMKKAEQEREVNIGKWQPIADNIGSLLIELPELSKVI